MFDELLHIDPAADEQSLITKEVPGWTVATYIDGDGNHTVSVTTPTGATHQSTAPPIVAA